MTVNAVVYSKTNCPYCDKVKQLLDILEINYVSYTLDVDFDRQQFIKEFGEGSTFPRVVFNDKFIGGCSETVRYLKENGYLT
jgi:glutaredoxin